MLIETKRLKIRYFEESDSLDLYDYLSDEEVVRYEPYGTYTLEEAREEAKRRTDDPDFLAVALESGKVIGNLYFSKRDFEAYELGYVFSQKVWGNGYATESCEALIKYAFENLNVHRIIATCNPRNENSWRLLERLNFRREGTLIQNIYFSTDEKGNPIWQDTYLYGLLKEEWQNRIEIK